MAFDWFRNNSNLSKCNYTVDGLWSLWTSWTGCSMLCNGGIQTRTKICEVPRFGGSRVCQGVGPSEVKSGCNTQTCPCNISYILYLPKVMSIVK